MLELPVVRIAMVASGKIRICHLQCLPIVAGAQRTMLHIFDSLDRCRFEPIVICQGPGPLIDELMLRGIDYYFSPSLVREIHPYHDWKVVGQLKRLFHKIKPDIVHTHSSKPGIVGRLAARYAGVPAVVHHVQGYAFHEFTWWPKKFFYQRLEAMAAKWTTRMIFVSQEERDASIKRGWVTAENSLRIPNVVDRSVRAQLNEFQRAARRRELGLAPDEVAILIVGRIDHQKQPEIFAPIAQGLRAANCKTKWKVLIAGDGPQMKSLEASIAKNCLQDKVRLLGWVGESYQIMQCCDIVLLPSLWEGLPLVLIEALGAGLPIVASSIKGNRELVSPDVGYLCAPRDPNSYVGPLKTLVENPLLRATMGSACASQAPDYDRNRVMSRVEALYDELTQRFCQTEQAHTVSITEQQRECVP